MMKHKVEIFHSTLLQAMGNPKNITVNGATVGECLDDLIKQYPVVEGLLFDKQHKLLRNMTIFVNAESLHRIEMTRQLMPKDFLIIVTLVAGG